jgi:hypothetical protein
VHAAFRDTLRAKVRDIGVDMCHTTITLLQVVDAAAALHLRRMDTLTASVRKVRVLSACSFSCSRRFFGCLLVVWVVG